MQELDKSNGVCLSRFEHRYIYVLDQPEVGTLVNLGYQEGANPGFGQRVGCWGSGLELLCLNCGSLIFYVHTCNFVSKLIKTRQCYCISMIARVSRTNLHFAMRISLAKRMWLSHSCHEK